MKISLVHAGDWVCMGTGISYLASAIRRTRHEAFLIDTFFKRDPAGYMLGKISEQGPDAVGFSVMTSTYKKSLDFADRIKMEHPGLPVIFGGVHPTLFPEETLASPSVDAVCIGEGEDSVIGYLDGLRGCAEISGIWFKHNGQIVRSPSRPFRDDLDSLAFPAWDMWDMERYFDTFFFPGSLTVISSRGCPYRCAFCSSGAISSAVPGRYYRKRSPENVVSEILSDCGMYTARGLRMLFFDDDDFARDPGDFHDFIGLYRREGLHERLFWACKARASSITGRWAREAASNGCIFVGIGLECGDENQRRESMGKDIGDREFRAAARRLHENNISFALHVIIGAPQDTGSSIRKTWSFARSLDPTFISGMRYIPLPGTPLGDRSAALGLATRRTRMESGSLRRTEHLGRLELSLFSIGFKMRNILYTLKKGIRTTGLVYLFKLATDILLMRENISYLKGYMGPSFPKRLIVRSLIEKRLKKSISCSAGPEKA